MARLASVTHFMPLAKIRKNRVLPAPGMVVVRAGQNVSPTDVIAQGSFTPKHIVLDVARGLGVSVAKAPEFITVAVGDPVEKDTIVARRSGILPRMVRASSPGNVVAISRGQVLIEVESSPYQELARIPGTVASVEGNLGAVVETSGAWLQGVWGNGKVDYGLLNIFADEPGHQLSAAEFHVSQRGTVVYAGRCRDARALQVAAELPIRGLILSSISPSILPAAREAPYPIIVIEGFGDLEMNSVAHKLLASNSSREIAINAEPYDRYSGRRPEIIIPLQGAGDPPVPRSVDNFSPGQRVRVARNPYIGAVGTILILIPGLTSLPSGLSAPSAEIELESGERTVVPLANIEVLG
jgi:hypothetical protein